MRVPGQAMDMFRKVTRMKGRAMASFEAKVQLLERWVLDGPPSGQFIPRTITALARWEDANLGVWAWRKPNIVSPTGPYGDLRVRADAAIQKLNPKESKNSDRDIGSQDTIEAMAEQITDLRSKLGSEQEAVEREKRLTAYLERENQKSGEGAGPAKITPPDRTPMITIVGSSPRVAQGCPSDIRVIRAGSQFKFAGRDAPKFPIVVSKAGVVLPILDYLIEKARKTDVSIGTLEGYAYILRDWFRYLSERRRAWYRADDDLLEDWKRAQKKQHSRNGKWNTIGDKRIELKLHAVSAFYRTMAMIYDRRGGADRPLGFDIVCQISADPETDEQRKAKGRPPKLRVRTATKEESREGRPTPTDDEIEKAYDVALQGKEDYPANVRWHCLCFMRLCGLRAIGVASLSLAQLTEALLGEKIDLPLPAQLAPMLTAIGDNDVAQDQIQKRLALRAPSTPVVPIVGDVEGQNLVQGRTALPAQPIQTIPMLHAIANDVEAQNLILHQIDKLRDRGRTEIFITVTEKRKVTRKVGVPIDFFVLCLEHIWGPRAREVERLSKRIPNTHFSQAMWLSSKTGLALQRKSISDGCSKALRLAQTPGSPHRLRARYAMEELRKEVELQQAVHGDIVDTLSILFMVAQRLGQKGTKTLRFYLNEVIKSSSGKRTAVGSHRGSRACAKAKGQKARRR